MLNSVKKFVNKEEIKHLLSSKKSLFETKNYYDKKTKKYNKEIRNLLNSSNKSNFKIISAEIEEYLDIQQINIAESKRLEHLIDEIDRKLSLLGYTKEG